MNSRQLVLLSPYRPPTTYPVTLEPAEAAAWLNAWAALWHPAALAGAVLPPWAAAAYDHHDPAPGTIYALPASPSLHLPEGWRERAAAAGATVFDAVEDRGQTLRNLAAALAVTASPAEDFLRACAGLGFAHLMLDTLFDAMNHEKLLDVERFWQAVQTAVAEPATGMNALAEAARMLADSRESLMTGGVNLLNIVLLNEANGFPADALDACMISPTIIAGNIAALATLRTQQPATFERIKSANIESVELALGVALERDDTLLPVESQLWNLQAAQRKCREMLGRASTLFARSRTEYHHQLPGWLVGTDFTGALLLNLDNAALPGFSSSLVQWPGPDGRVIGTYTRTPLAADDPLTMFNLGYHFYSASQHESRPTLAFIHTQPPAASYTDWRAVDALAPIFGEWTRLATLLENSHDADYVPVPSPDEFARDVLDARTASVPMPDAVSSVARHHRERRRLDAAFAMAALHRGLTEPTADDSRHESTLHECEDSLERTGALPASFAATDDYWQHRLAERILARSASGPRGYLVLNPCGFTRRVGVELAGEVGAIAVEGPVKASEFAGGVARAVVEVPGLGYAWIPRGTPGASPKPRLVTAEPTCVRNEFLEAEIDPASGGVKAIRDARLRVHRLGQMLHYPGCRMVAQGVTVTHAGAAMGEVTSTGHLVNEQNEQIAAFTQRLRAWIGRPAIELHIEITPRDAVNGFAWQNAFTSRFAWRDDRSALHRGAQGVNCITTQHRFAAPDYFEIRHGRERTCIFTGGLAFMQTQGRRMADVILIPEGERATTFELLIAFDRDYPMATAAGWLSPAPVLPVDRGPPPMGTTGWLAGHDLPSLLLTSLRPSTPGDGLGRAVTARFLETAGFAASADFRFAKDPHHATAVNVLCQSTMSINMNAGAIPITASASELVTVNAEWKQDQ